MTSSILRTFVLRSSLLFIAMGAMGLSGLHSEESLHRPPSFSLGQDHPAVFVDFQSMQTKIEISTQEKKAIVTALVTFTTETDGFPLFDLTQNPGAVWLDGEQISTREIEDPDAVTKLRIFTQWVAAGVHEAAFHYELKNEVVFREAGAELGFWMNDLKDRQFLEQYVPANLEYDAFAMSLIVAMDDDLSGYSVFANGRRVDIDQNHFRIDFPKNYNSSSPFFHLIPSSMIQREVEVFEDLNGRRIPVTVYSKGAAIKVSSYMKRALLTLQELQNDYGPFPHAQLIVYASPSFGGGMEHAGATITSLSALSHEITHSYFGRALMPANGNAGWMDEALASWRDARYPSLQDPGYSRGNLAGFSKYRRNTPDAAYTKGRNFMAYLDQKLKDSSHKSLKIFLREFLKQRAFQPLLTTDFQRALEIYAGQSFAEDFNRYIYNKNDDGSLAEDDMASEDADEEVDLLSVGRNKNAAKFF